MNKTNQPNQYPTYQQPMQGQGQHPMPNQNQPMYPQFQDNQPMYQQPLYQQPMQGQGQPMYQQPMQGQGQPMYQQPMQGQGQGQPMYQPPVSGQPLLQPIGQPGVQPVNNGPQIGGMPSCFSPNALEELQNANSALVKQEVELIEVVTGCETPNRYHVFITNRSGAQTYLFKCKEKSSWCERNCCPSNLRAFNLRVKHMTGQVDSDNWDNYYVGFERPFKCTCCCFCRPTMLGKFRESDVFFGKIIEPCTICSPIFDVYDKDSNLKWRIVINCCQCGFCCRSNFWGKLSSVVCSIQTPDGVEVGRIAKKTEGLRQLVSDADTYRIDFPTDASPCEKLTLIGASLLIDYRYYENDGCKDDKKDKHGPHVHLH